MASAVTGDTAWAGMEATAGTAWVDTVAMATPATAWRDMAVTGMAVAVRVVAAAALAAPVTAAATGTVTVTNESSKFISAGRAWQYCPARPAEFSRSQALPGNALRSRLCLVGHLREHSVWNGS